MIDLSKNTNPYYPNKKMLSFLKRNIGKISQYSSDYVDISPNNSFLKLFGLSKDNIVITNGTMGAMDLILKDYSGKKIGLFSPTFWGIKTISEKNNLEIISKEINISQNYNLSDISELASECEILYICNNNNPTLNYISPKKLLEIIKVNPQCLFIIDETVLAFDKDYRKKTIIGIVEDNKNIVVLLSLSKIFGVCGLRCGLLITSSTEKIKYINNQVPYSINIQAAIFADKYLSLFNNIEKYQKKIEKNFLYFINKLDNDVFINYYYNYGSFMMIQLNNNINYDIFVNYLLKKGIKISPITKFYPNIDGNFIRVSAGKKKNYKKFVNIIKKFRREYSNEKSIY